MVFRWLGAGLECTLEQKSPLPHWWERAWDAGERAAKRSSSLLCDRSPARLATRQAAVKTVAIPSSTCGRPVAGSTMKQMTA